MKKGEIIYRTSFVIIYFMILLINIETAIRISQWTGFCCGVAITLILFALIINVVKLITGEVKNDKNDTTTSV